MKHVLVVEDEPLIRMVAADALLDAGMIVWEAGDAEEALELLQLHVGIGLMFTDINMPGQIDGLRLAHQVSVDWPEVELIVTSGAAFIADEDLPDHVTFLAKPYQTQILLGLVADKLGTAST